MGETLTFEDLDDGDEAIVIVRRLDSGVALTVSKRSDGDIQVCMTAAAAERLAAALRDAVA